jgi:hypothetical protein
MSVHQGVSLIVFPQELDVPAMYLHHQSRSEFSSGWISPSNDPATESLEPEEKTWQCFHLFSKYFCLLSHFQFKLLLLLSHYSLP